jgi:hypothetical protein
MIKDLNSQVALQTHANYTLKSSKHPVNLVRLSLCFNRERDTMYMSLVLWCNSPVEMTDRPSHLQLYSR